MRSFVLLSATLALLGACGSPRPVVDAGRPGGTSLFRFDVAKSVRDGTMPNPPKGSAYGGIYLQEDVGISGPHSGAMQFGDVTVDNLDLTAGISSQSYETLKLLPGKYVFLGFLDTNHDGATTKDPNSGDLVTLPTTNPFEIIDGVQGKKTIVFDLVFN